VLSRPVGRSTRRATRAGAYAAKRLMNVTSVNVNPDPRSTSLITIRPFSYKVSVTVDYNSTTLLSSYAAIFPDLVTSGIKGVRIDRIAVWGTQTAATPIYLSFGRYFSRKDVGGANHRSRICCIPKMEKGENDESTLISYKGAEEIHISGVVYVLRESFAPVQSGTVSGIPSSTFGTLPLNGSSPTPPVTVP